MVSKPKRRAIPIKLKTTPESNHPSERLPQWAKPINGEGLEAYRDRLETAISLDTLERSLRGDTAAHAKWREQALKALGIGQRQEIDVVAKQAREELALYTDEELIQIKAIQDRAKARKSLIPQDARSTGDGTSPEDGHGE